MKNNRISSIARSKLLRSGLLAVFFLVCVALLSMSGWRVSSQTSTPTPPPQAQNETKSVARLISDAKRTGRDFSTVEPFNRQTRSVAADAARRRAVTAGSILQLRPNALAELVNRNAPSLTLRLPTFAGPPVELELVQVDLFAQGFNVVTSDSNGQPVTYDRGVHYWGVIKGIEDSLAAISVFKDEVIGTYSSAQEGNFVLGKIAGNNPARDHILYAEKDLTSTMSVSCDMPDDNTAFSPQELDSSSSAVTRCVKIYIEADFDLFQNRGSVNATVNFVTGVFNQSAALFSNEGIPISISEIFVWTSPSPYNGSFSDQQLAQFQNVRTSFNGDIAHLVDLQSNQGGIAAGFNGFCNPNRSQSQCYSGIDPFFNNVPTYSWTVFVFTHEMGHLFGSRHTHACVWNGNNTAIDSCSGFTEGGCFLPGIPGDGGTVMSYCHLQSVGINFSKGFGPQPGNVIRNQFNSAPCLGTCGSGCGDGFIGTKTFSAISPSIGHTTGRQEGTSWAANVLQDTDGYLGYGPYDSTFGQGHHKASFLLRIDNNTTGPLDDVAVLDVVVSNNGVFTELAHRVIKRHEFTGSDVNQWFDIEFDNPCFGLLETRVWWVRSSYMRFSELTIQRMF